MGRNYFKHKIDLRNPLKKNYDILWFSSSILIWKLFPFGARVVILLSLRYAHGTDRKHWNLALRHHY